MKLNSIRWCVPLAGVAMVVMASSATAETRLKPGLWELNIQSLNNGAMPEMPKLTPQQQAQMEKMGIKLPGGGAGGVGMTVRTCLTKEQVERNEPPKPRDDDRQKCQQTEMKRSGNTVNWKMVCTGEHPMTGSGSMTMESAESYSSTVDMVSQDPRYGATAVSSKMKGKWLGPDCAKK